MNINEALKILDLKEFSNLKDLTTQRNFLLQCFHPDKHSKEEARVKAEEKTKKILEAFEYIKNNPNQKIEFDYDQFNERFKQKYQKKESKTKTVAETYCIDEDALFEMADNNEGYYQACYNFYQSVKNLGCNYLTEKQKSWLMKIKKATDEYDFEGF